MRDWVDYVGRRLHLADLVPERQNRIVHEVASQMEDAYLDYVENGLTAEEADFRVRSHIDDWNEFSRQLTEAARRDHYSPAERWCQQVEEMATQKRGLLEMFSELQKDVVYSFRRLRSERLYTLAALLILTIGIGANALTFSFVKAALFQPLSLPKADRLVYISEQTPEGLQSAPYAVIESFDRESDLLAAASGMVAQSVNLTGEQEPTRVRGGFVSGSFFEVVEVAAASGRTLHEQDDKLGAEPVVVISHPLWKNRYGEDPQILGRRLQLNGQPFTVIGVLPEDFRFPIDAAEVWLPLRQWHNFPEMSHAWWNFGRLEADVSVAAAEKELNRLLETLVAEDSNLSADSNIHLQPLQDFLIGDDRQNFLLFTLAVGLVLFIVCANIANLQLAQGAYRRRELAIRAALGAGRLRLVRQVLTENLVLGLGGAILGLLVARWGVYTLSASFADFLYGQEVQFDIAVVFFTVLLALFTGITFGLLPAVQAGRLHPIESLKEGGRADISGPRIRWLTGAFVILQLTLAVIMLVGTGLLLRSFANLSAVDPGFDATNLLTFEYRLPPNQYSDPSARRIFHEAVIDQIRGIPGVQSAALIQRFPFSGNRGYEQFSIPGILEPTAEEAPFTFVNLVGTQAFEVMAVPVLAGRSFQTQDANGPPVAVINRTMAEEYWQNRNPVGSRIQIDEVQAKVIGVVENVKYLSLTEEPIPQVYGYTAQNPSIFMTVGLRTAGDPLSYADIVRQAVWEVDPNQPMWKFRTAEAMIRSELDENRVTAYIILIFSVIALTLAAVGVFAVVAYSVNQRHSELAVRITLGAASKDLILLILRRVVIWTGAGIVLGLSASVLFSNLLSGMLYGVTSNDPWNIAMVVFILAFSAIAAALLPARRALQVDPARTLSSE